MPDDTTEGIEPSDVLGGAMFVVGAVIILNLGDVPPPMDSPIIGIIVMVLGIGAVFGRKTFAELVRKVVFSNGEMPGNSDRDGTSGDEGDDETDDGEVGINPPPGDEVKPET
jgi:hypothetical protein